MLRQLYLVVNICARHDTTVGKLVSERAMRVSVERACMRVSERACMLYACS